MTFQAAWGGGWRGQSDALLQTQQNVTLAVGRDKRHCVKKVKETEDGFKCGAEGDGSTD